MIKNSKYSTVAIVGFVLLLPTIAIQYLYLQNISVPFYVQIMEWLFSSKEHFKIETYHSMTFFILLMALIRLNKDKKHVYLPIKVLLGLSSLILIISIIEKSQINNSLTISASVLIICGLLMILLHKASYRKFDRPCTPAGLRSMNAQTSIYDIAYLHVPIILLISSWYI